MPVVHFCRLPPLAIDCCFRIRLTAVVHRSLLAQLRESSPDNDRRAKAAWAVSKFAASASSATTSNQDVLGASGIELLVSLLSPEHNGSAPAVLRRQASTTMHMPQRRNRSSAEKEEYVPDLHSRTQMELCAALWAITKEHPINRRAVADAGGVPVLIAMLEDHPDIHYQAAGAVWSLSVDPTNQRLVAEAGGITKLIELLKPPPAPNPAVHSSVLLAQETVAGALHSLTARAENRELIAQADGITHLVPLLFGSASELTKAEASEALLSLCTSNPEHVFTLVTQTTSWLAKTPLPAQEAAGTTALQVIHTLSLDDDNQDAFSRTGIIGQLEIQLNAGAEQAQKLAANTLTNIAKISISLRKQVSQQLVKLLTHQTPDM